MSQAKTPPEKHEYDISQSHLLCMYDAEEVKKRAMESDTDEIIKCIDELEKNLGIYTGVVANDEFMIKYFDLENSDYNKNGIDKVHAIADGMHNVRIMPYIARLHADNHKLFNTATDYDDPNPVLPTLGLRLNRISEENQRLRLRTVGMINSIMSRQSALIRHEYDPKDICAPISWAPGEEQALNDFQQLTCYALQYMHTRRYRRYQDYVCKEIGNTRAWEKISKIEVFVEGMFDRHIDFQNWCKFTKTGNTRKNLIEHLTVCKDWYFPDLVKNRHAFSFRNGLYIAMTKDKESKFYPYDSEEFKSLDQMLVSSKYFDMDFDNSAYDNWYDIPTPCLDRILNYQKFDDDVKKCVMLFIGRMLYDVNELEKWQVIMFLKGMASTGKGMICQLCTYFYEDEDIGTLGDNPEKQFGLSAIYEKKAFVAPEITGRFGLCQADFQSMVSGENVSIGRKHKTAESVKWKVPGILAGNEPPGYHDNSGSIQRRLVTIPFPIQVKPEDVDTELPDKLRAEVPFILRKVNEAYHDAISRFVSGGIWAHLPNAIKKTREEMALSTNALRHFMASPQIEYGSDKQVPLNILITHFNEHCKANNLGRYKFTPDFYNGPFGSKGISVEQKTIKYRNKNYKNHSIVVGLDVEMDDDEFLGDF